MLVIVPLYNAEAWIIRSLQSLGSQKSVRFRAVVIDDASTDDSSAIARALCDSYGFFYERNEVNRKCPYNIWAMTQAYVTDQEEPVVILDGDDWFPHDHVLEQIAQTYEDPNIWLSYGSYESSPFDPLCQPAMRYSEMTIKERSYRKAGNLFNHPLSWRAWLFNKIPVEQMKTPEGEWFRSGYDRVFMWPMLEMATEYDGTCHWMMDPRTLYTYNSVNPISEVHVNLDAHKEAECCVNYPVLEPACRP